MTIADPWFSLLLFQSAPIVNTEYGFDIQLSKLYTRGVYNRFKEVMKSHTAFSIEDNAEKGAGNYLVRHRKVDTNFPWIEHSFEVVGSYNAESPESSVFKCECLTWQNTGASMSVF